MEEMQLEREMEEAYLQRTKEAAERQLEQARRAVEEGRLEMEEARRELQENTESGMGSGLRNYNSAADFEALVELSQNAAPVARIAADYEELMRKIRRLEKLLKSPYFARIDFCFQGEEEPEKVYIGRTSLMEKGAMEIYVYDWRSPIASVFYRFMTGEAYYDAPNGRIEGEVERKRQYEIRDGRLLYFFDTNVSISDEILKQLLGKNTSPKMKTIVETIQRDQDIVIRNMENDLLMIQGVAGSGKTSIALHRAAYLMYQGVQSGLSSNNILILSPNSTFEQYISDVLPELGEENVVSMVFEDLLRSVLKERELQPQNAFLEKAVSHSAYTQLAKGSMEYKTSERFRDILDRFAEEIPRWGIEYQDVYLGEELIVTKEELKRRAMQRPEVPLAERLEQLKTYVMEEAFGGRRDKRRITLTQELQNFLKVDIYGLYEGLWRDGACIEALGAETQEKGKGQETQRGKSCGAADAGSGSGDDIDQIRRYTLENLESGRLYFDDAIALLYLHLKIYGSRYRHIRQVIIDEAQDYYPLQYEIFRLLFPGAKYTVLGDVNQTLTKREDISFYEQVRDILKRKNSALITLDKSFRCTNEILRFGLRFLASGHRPGAAAWQGPMPTVSEGGLQEDPLPDGIKCFNRSGDAVTVEALHSSEEYLDRIAEEVAFCREKGYETICLLCKTKEGCSHLFSRLRSRLELKMFGDDGVGELKGNLLLPSYMAKGLEFDAVIICDADSRNYYDDDDKKILYVECTRALHRLSLFCEGELTSAV